MPDANKLKVLQLINYKISPCCGMCKFAKFVKTDWGSCSKHSYTHEKHTGEARPLSIYRAGYCASFEGKPEVTEELAKSGFLDFASR